MAINVYLALTGGEMDKKTQLPEKIAWMACHFSPGSEGLSNCPRWLPPGSLLILDDSLPLQGHDPGQVCRELSALLERHQCSGLLLDLQRPGAEAMIRHLLSQLCCTVILPDRYAALGSGPVLVPPVPPHRTAEGHLAPWAGRQIWLELEAQGRHIRLTPEGAEVSLWNPQGDTPHRDRRLCCSYRTETDPQQAHFFLRRTPEDLALLLEDAQRLGAAGAVGLGQEFMQWA